MVLQLNYEAYFKTENYVFTSSEDLKWLLLIMMKEGDTLMKKYMIRCDIEGVSGVVSYEQAEPGNPEFEFGKRMFMSDLLALIDGLNQGGADEIWGYDEHYYGRNIDIDRLPKNVTSICGKPPYRLNWAGKLDDSTIAYKLKVPLTTVRQPREEIGKKAERIVLSAKLIIRESSVRKN